MMVMDWIDGLLQSAYFTDELGATILDAAVRGSLLILAAATVALFVRRSAASIRYTVWTIALMALAALPVFSALLPDLRVPQLSLRSSAANVIVELEPTVAAHDAKALSTGNAGSGAAGPVENAADIYEGPQSRMPNAVISIAVLLWLFVACWLLVRLRRSILHLREYAARATEVLDARTIQIAASLAREMGVRSRVRILESDGATPVTWGHARPVIVLPASASEWSESRTRRVLLHELAHVRRGDWLAQVLTDVVTALYWFNPLVWIAARQMRAEREYACDDVVLLAGCRASSYADDLVEIVREVRVSAPTAIAGLSMVGSTQLHRRLHALLDAGRSRGGLAGRTLIALLTVAIPLTVLFSTAQPARAQHDLTGLRSAPSLSPCWQLVPGVRMAHLKRGPTDAHIGFTRRRCSAEMVAHGDIGFSSDFTSVVSMAPGSTMRMTEVRNGTSRELRAEPDAAGKPRFTWTVDGRVRPFDAHAQRWLERELLVLFRVGGFASDVRADTIINRGGVQGLLRELPKLLWTSRAYERRLLQRVSADEKSLVQVVTTGRDVLSDEGLSDALVALAQPGRLQRNGALREQWLAAVADIQDRGAYGRAMSAFVSSGGER